MTNNTVTIRYLSIIIFIITITLAFPETVHADDGDFNPPQPVEIAQTEEDNNGVSDTSDHVLGNENSNEVDTYISVDGEETESGEDTNQNTTGTDTIIDGEAMPSDDEASLSANNSSNADADSVVNEINHDEVDEVGTSNVIDLGSDPINPVTTTLLEETLIPEMVSDESSADSDLQETASGKDPYYTIDNVTYYYRTDCTGYLNCTVSTTPIQAAIDAIKASGTPILDDTLYVEGGVYSDNIVIDGFTNALNILGGVNGVDSILAGTVTVSNSTGAIRLSNFIFNNTIGISNVNNVTLEGTSGDNTFNVVMGGAEHIGLTVNGGSGVDSLDISGSPQGGDLELSSSSVETITISMSSGDDQVAINDVTGENPSDVTVDGGVGNDAITVSGNVLLRGGDISLTSETVVVNAGVTISTRNISDIDQNAGISIGNSGNILINAQMIEIQDNAKLFAHAGNGFAPGDVFLNATNKTISPEITFAAIHASIEIGTNVMIKGGDIELKSEAGDENNGGDPTIESDYEVDPLNSFLGMPQSLPLAVMVKLSSASVQIGSNSQIIGSGSVNIEAVAVSDATAEAIHTLFSLGFSWAGASAEVTIDSGVQIVGNGDVTIHSSASSTADMTTRTLKNLGDAPADSKSMAISVAIAYGKITSITTVMQDASITSLNGNVNVISRGSNTVTADAEAGSYTDGRAGFAISLTFTNADVQALVGGNLTAKGAAIADPDSDLTAGIGVKAILQSTNSSSALGGTGGDITASDEMDKGEVEASGLISKLTQAYSENSDKDKVQSNASSDVSAAGALSFLWVENEVTATITGSAILKSERNLDVIAEITQKVQTYSESSIEKPDESTKDVAVSGAVSVVLYNNKALVSIESGAVMDAKGATTVSASIEYPFFTDPLDYANSLNPGVALQSGIDGVGNYIEDTLGLQSALFNSWVNSTSEADNLSIAGSVNFMSFTNIAEAIVYSNVSINQDPAYQTVAQSVNVESEITVRLINMTGTFDFDLSADVVADLIAKGDPLGSISPIGSNSGKGGMGGSIFILLMENRSLAKIETGALIHTGSGGTGFTLAADTSLFNFSFAQSGASAGQFGVAGTFSLNVITNVTEALLAGGVTVTGGPLAVKANDDTVNINVAGGVMKGSGIGIGASIAINVLDRTTRAVIGSANLTTPGGPSEINVNGDVEVAATSGGYVWSFSAAAAMVSEEKPQAETGTTGGSDSTPDLNDKSDPLDGLSLPLLFSEDTASTDDAKKQAEQRQTGVAIAGNVSLNYVKDTTIAAINDSGTVLATGAVEVIADSETRIISVSGAAAFSSAGASTSAGISGAFSVIALDADTQAFISGTTINADHLIVDAKHGGYIGSLTAGGAGETKADGIGVAGSVAVNVILTDTQAYLKNVTATLVMSSGVTAADETMIVSVAGAVAFGGKAGVGLSLAVNLIGVSNIPFVPDSPATTRAYIEDSTIIMNGGTLDVLATNTIGSADPRIVAITGSGGFSTGSSSIAGAGMISINIVENFIEAYIKNSTITDVVDAQPLNVNVNASDDSWIISVGGAVAVGGGTSIGAAIGYNQISSTIQAFLDNTRLTISGLLDVAAESKSMIASASLGAAGSTGNGISAAGSLSINVINNTVRAYINNNSQVTTGGAITLLAKDVSWLVSVAGSGALAANSVAGGAAVSYNLITNTIDAFILSSEVSTQSTLSIAASSLPTMIALAVSGSISSDVSFSGSITVNSISNMVDAHISGTDSDRSDINVIGDVTITAHESPVMYVVAGALAASGGSASVGISLAYNYVGGSFDPYNPNVISVNTSTVEGNSTDQPVVDGADSLKKSNVTAYISYTDLYTSSALYLAGGFDAPTTLPSLSSVDIDVAVITIPVPPTAQITSLSIAGSVASTTAITGAVSLNFIHSNVNVYISNTPFNGAVKAYRNVSLLATDTSSIYSAAGLLAIAANPDASFAFGASISVNEIQNTVSSYIENAKVVSLTGNVALISNEKATIVNVTAGGAFALVSASGSISVNFVKNIVDAHISKNANVNAFGNVNLSAQDTSLIIVVAGNISGNVGASVAVNHIADTVTAIIDGSSVNSSNGNIELNASVMPPALFPTIKQTPGVNAQIYAFAVSGSGTDAFSITLNWIRNTVEAKITNIVLPQVVTASTGGINLTASDNSSINSLAGAASGSVGISLAYNFLGGDPSDPLITDSNIVRAAVENSTGSIHAKQITLSASTTSAINNATLAGSAGGTLTGAVSLNRIRNLTEAYLLNSSNINGLNGVSVSASDTSTISSIAGFVSGGSGVGTALAYNEIYNNIKAYIQDSAVTSTAGSIIVAANSDATINTIAAGIATSTVAGSVVVNLISNTAEAFILNSTVVAEHNIAVLANSLNTINAFGGTISGSIAGMGGSAVANLLTNITRAYISGSTVIAKGNGGTVTVKKWATDAAGTESTENICGLAVIASSNEIIKTYGVTASVGGVGIAANLITTIVKDTTEAYILNSLINEKATWGQRVLVRAHQNTDITSGSATVAAGLAGIAAIVDVNIIANNTQAYISDSTVYGGAGVEVSVLTREKVESVVIGAADATFSAAGAASAVSMASMAKAYIANSEVKSGAGLQVLANNYAKVEVLPVTGSVGFVGAGGTIGVVIIKNETSAYTTGGSTQSTGSTLVQADSTEDVAITAGAGGAGLVGSLNAAVAVVDIATKTTAYINGQANSDVDVSVLANNSTKVDDKVGTVALAGGLSVGGSIDVIIITNTVDAHIGSGSVIVAGNNISVKATAKRDVDSAVIAFAGAVGVSASGAVSVINIGVGLSDSQSSLKNDSGVSSSFSPSSVLGNINAALGYSDKGFGSGSTSTQASTGIKINPIKVDFPDTAVTGSTTAYVGENADLTATNGSIIIFASQIPDTNCYPWDNDGDICIVSSTVDATAGGAALSASYSVGGSVVLVTLNEATMAYVGRNTTLSAGGDITVKAVFTDVVNAYAYGGAAGGVAALGAQVAIITDNSSQSAYMDGDKFCMPSGICFSDAAKIVKAGVVTIDAEAHRTLNAEAKGGTAGAFAAGAAVANISAGGSTTSYLGLYTQVGQQAGQAVSALNIRAINDTTATANEWAVAAGIGSFSYNEAKASVSPVVDAYIGQDSNVTVTDNVSLTAQALVDAKANSYGVSAGGVAVGVSNSSAKIAPTVKAYIGSHAQVSAGGNILIQALYNFDLLGNRTNDTATAFANASAGGLVGGVGAKVIATAGGAAEASAGSSAQVTAGKNFNLISHVNTTADARGDGNSYGIVGVGDVQVVVNSLGSSKAYISSNASVTAANNVGLLAYLWNESKAKSTQAAGGIVTVGGSSATANINPNVYAFVDSIGKFTSTKIISTNGSISILAQLDGPDSYMLSAIADGYNNAAITVGASKADAKLTGTVQVYTGPNVMLTAGYDIRIDALTKATVKASATASNGSLIGVSGADATSNINLKTNANLGYENTITAGHDFLLYSTSDIDVLATASVTGSGLITLGTITSGAEIENTTQINTGSATSIKAGHDAVLNAVSYCTVSSTADGISGAATVTTANVKATTKYSPTTKISISSSSNFSAVNSMVVLAKSTIKDVSATASSSGAAGITVIRTDAKVEVKALTEVLLLDNSKLSARDLSVFADVAGLFSYSLATSGAEGFGGGAYSTVENNTTSDAIVNIKQGVALVGHNSVEVKAQQQYVIKSYSLPVLVPIPDFPYFEYEYQVFEWSLPFAHSYASAITQAFAGEATAKATTNLTSNTLINAEAGSTISTHNLLVEATIPPGILFNAKASREGSKGLIGGDSNKYGDLILNRTINFGSDVTLLGGSPLLIIDANGNIEQQNGVTFTSTPTSIIVDDINGNGYQATATFRMGTSVYDPTSAGEVQQTVIDTYKPDTGAWYGNFTFDVNNTWGMGGVFEGMTNLDAITLINKSDKDFVINNIWVDGVTSWVPQANGEHFKFHYEITDNGYLANVPQYNLQINKPIYNGFPMFTVGSVSGITYIMIQNIDDPLDPQGPSNIILQGLIYNIFGTTSISTDQGDILMPVVTARIISYELTLEAAVGQIGQSGAPIHMMVLAGFTAHASGDIYLEQVSGNFYLKSVTSSAGLVNIVSAGSILDLDNDTAADITGQHIDLTSATGSIGTSANALEIDAQSAVNGLRFSANLGVFINDIAGDLSVGKGESTSGEINLHADTGDMNIDSGASISAPSGVTLSANDDFVLPIGAQISSANLVSITSLGSGLNSDIGALINVLGGVSAPTVTITSGVNNDSITIAHLPAGTTMTVNAGVGNDSTSMGSVNINGNWGGTATLNGGDGDDTFALVNGASFGGNIEGGVGVNTLTYASYGSPVSITLSDTLSAHGFAGTGTGLAGAFSNMDILVGTSGVDTFNGTNLNSTFEIHSVDPDVYSAGGNSAQLFAFEHYNGGAGVNTLTYASYGSPVSVTLSDTLSAHGFAGTGTDLGGTFSNMDILVGTSGVDTFNGTNLNSTFEIYSADPDVYSVGGNSAQLFAFEHYNGGAGVNTLTYASYGSPVSVTLSDTLSAHGFAGTGTGLAGAFSNMDILVGTSGVDTFNGTNLNSTFEIHSTDPDVYSVGGNSAQLFAFEHYNGGAGVNTLTYAFYDSPVSLTLSDTLSTHGFAGTGTGLGGAFSNMDEVIGTPHTDTLNGLNLPADWQIAAVSSYTAGGRTLAFSAIETLNGGSDTDTFIVDEGASFDQTLNGGAGYDTLDFHLYDASGVKIILNNGGDLDGYFGVTDVIKAFDNINLMRGTLYQDALFGLNLPSLWNITNSVFAYKADSFDFLDFYDVEIMNGGNDQDGFVVNRNTIFPGVVNGGLGYDILDVQSCILRPCATVNGPGSLDGFQGMASLIAYFDNIEFIIRPTRTAKLIELDSPWVLVIPVKSGETVSILCNKCSAVILRLPENHQVNFQTGLGDTASLTRLFPKDLPESLPGNICLAYGMNIDLLRDDLIVKATSEPMVVSYVVPLGLPVEDMMILFWDPDLNNSQGGWLELPVYLSEDEFGWRIHANVNRLGIYVLAVRSQSGSCTCENPVETITRTLESGEFVEVMASCGSIDEANLSPVLEVDLPIELPEDIAFIDGIKLDTYSTKVLLVDLPPGGIMTTRFPVPVSLVGRDPIILFWDGTQWVKTETKIFEMDGKVWAQIMNDKSGLYILVEWIAP